MLQKINNQPNVLKRFFLEIFQRNRQQFSTVMYCFLMLRFRCKYLLFIFMMLMCVGVRVEYVVEQRRAGARLPRLPPPLHGDRQLARQGGRRGLQVPPRMARRHLYERPHYIHNPPLPVPLTIETESIHIIHNNFSTLI